MIPDAILNLLATVVNAAFSLLPTSSIGVIPNCASCSGGWNTVAAVGGYVGQWDGVIPVLFMLRTIATVAAIIFPAVAIYKSANWLYKHIPQIGGFGPGSG